MANVPQPSFFNRVKQWNPFTRKNNSATASSSPSWWNRIWKKKNTVKNNYRTQPWMRPKTSTINKNKNSPSWWNRIWKKKNTVKNNGATTSPSWWNRIWKKNATVKNNYRTRPWMRPRTSTINGNRNVGWNGTVFPPPPPPPPSREELEIRAWQAKRAQELGLNGTRYNVNDSFNNNLNYSTGYETRSRNTGYNSLGGKRNRH